MKQHSESWLPGRHHNAIPGGAAVCLLVSAAVLFGGADYDIDESPGLTTPGAKIIKVPGTTKSCFNVTATGDQFTTWDMRGVKLDAHAPGMANDGRPMDVIDPKNTMCFLGVVVQGVASRNTPWTTHKSRYDDGVHITHLQNAHVIFEAMWNDNLHDPIQSSRGGQYVGPNGFVTIRHSYFRYCRDDFFENDGCAGFMIDDVFVDGAHMGISVRNKNTSGYDNVTGTIQNSLIRMEAHADTRTSDGLSVAQMFKWCGAANSHVKLTVKNTIFRQDRVSKNGAKTMNWPSGTYQNVTVIWGGSGNWPGQSPPSGVKVTKDMSVWNKASADWLKRHDCDAKGDVCTWNSDGGTTGAAKPSPAAMQRTAVHNEPIMVSIFRPNGAQVYSGILQGLSEKDIARRCGSTGVFIIRLPDGGSMRIKNISVH